MNIEQGISKSEVLFRRLHRGEFNNKRNTIPIDKPAKHF